MSEEFSDDFIIEEEEQGANRTFLIIAGSLVGLFILIIACVALFAVLNGGDGNADQVATIEAENATTIAQNARVTETIVAMELTQNAPTATSPPTDTPEPTDTATATPEPTDTSVVQTPDAGTVVTGTVGVETPGVSEDGGTTTVTPNAAGTQIFGDSGGTFGTVTPISGAGTGAGTDTLPQTGVTTAGMVGIGLLLIAVIFVARRLRTG
jgi:LPXTG-motif cell wall-anchored protein